MSRLAWLLLPLAIAAVACQKESPATYSEPETTSSPDSSGDVAEGGADAGITMRYGCDEGHSVVIVGGETARVTLADGRAVDIPRIADTSPPRYSGEALSFDIGSDGAMLGQHEVGGFACREAE